MEYADSALVRAVRRGRVLVVDEADKAPTNVTSVLRTLLDTGSMWLSGRFAIRIYFHMIPFFQTVFK